MSGCNHHRLDLERPGETRTALIEVWEPMGDPYTATLWIDAHGEDSEQTTRLVYLTADDLRALAHIMLMVASRMPSAPARPEGDER